LAALLANSDCVVIIAPHASIDWTAVFAGSDLIVDTVDRSAGQATRPRQVLRLGAGWTTRA